MPRYGFASTSTRATRARVSQRAARQAVASALRAPRPSRVMRLPMRPEIKYTSKNLVSDFGSVTSAWSESIHTGIGTGAYVTQRVGNKIAINSFTLHGVLANGSSGTSADDPYNNIRLIIAIWDRSWTAPMTSWASVDSTIFNAPVTKYANNGGARLIKKIFDQYIPLEVTGTEKGSGDGYTPALRNVDLYFKFKKPIIVNYVGSTSTTSAALEGPDKNLIISIASDSSVIPNAGFISGYSVMTFYDV